MDAASVAKPVMKFLVPTDQFMEYCHEGILTFQLFLVQKAKIILLEGI